MPNLTAIIQSSAAYAWLYLPVAVALGALHALEPGHAKSLMAGYIVAVRGNARQAVLLGISAAVGHTFIVWILAIAAFAFGRRYIVEEAEPWITAISGILIMLLGLRMLFVLRRGHHHHDHGHDHHSGEHDHDHHHAPAKKTRRHISNSEVIWFGFTGGLMPCPSALAVLLICVQLKAFALGVAMVAAFSVGVGATLVAIGLAVIWSSGRLANRWLGFERAMTRLPYISGGLVLIVGALMAVAGLNAAGVLANRRAN